MNVNQAAFLTATLTTGTALACGLIAMKTAATASTVALVAYAILGVVAAAASVGSTLAWFNPENSDDTKKYFADVRKITAGATVGILQFLLVELGSGIAQGLKEAASTWCRRQFGGADNIVEFRLKNQNP